VKAILLAAGAGTRCYPFTYLTPKLFQQICGIPLVEYMLSWFSGTPEVETLYIVVRDDNTAATLENYLEKRPEYLAQILDLYQTLGYRVDYTNTDFKTRVITARGWGTGGDLRCALDHISESDTLGEDLLVCYADYIINRKLPDGSISLQMDLSDISSYHRHCREALGTVMTTAFVKVAREEATRFGVGQLEEIGEFKVVRGFMEKPGIDKVGKEPVINAGVSVIDSQFLQANKDKFLPRKPDTSFERNFTEPLARQEKPVLAAYILKLDAWFDVGTLEQLVRTSVFIATGKE
jgi:NDP-sugar pyrophosphorylase family protein